MARPPRPLWPGALYHVTAHGGDDRPLYLGDSDRAAFLLLFDSAAAHSEWICHAYCLMDTHYHFLLETPKPNLSEGMHRVNTGYARNFNRRHGRRGHVFRSRFHCVVVQRHSHLVALSRYIVLNPVRAGICSRPEEWLWSSYRAAVGLAAPAPFLTTTWILSVFDDEEVTAREEYRAYVDLSAKRIA